MTSSQMMLFGGTAAATFVAQSIEVYRSSGNIANGGIVGVGTDVYTSAQDPTAISINVVKTSVTGAITFQRQLTLTGSTSSNISGITAIRNNVAADSSGNVYVVGWFENSSGVRTGMVAKYNSSGTIQWQRRITNTGNNAGFEGIAIDSTGANIAVIGSIPVGGTSGTAVMRYNSSGVLQWQRQLSFSGQPVIPRSISIDSSGNVFAYGQESATGAFNGFLVKYNSSGTLQFQRRITYGSNQGSVNYVKFDASGNIFSAGAPGIVKMDSSGVRQWGFEYTSTSDFPAAAGMYIDQANGNIYGFGGTNNFATFSRFDSSGANNLANKVAGVAVILGPYNTAGAPGTTGYMLLNSQMFNNSSKSSMNIFRLPLNGSQTGGGNITQVNWTFTYNTGTTSSATSVGTVVANSLTDGAGTQTDAAGAFTDAASSFNANLVSF